MRTELFNKVIEAAVDRSLAMMAKKNDEYSGSADYDLKAKVDDDRLRGCKSVADIQGVNIFRAIGGLMAKHTSSVYDLIRDTESGEVADMSVWQEKITDHINYLLLLEAAVRDQKDLTELNLANGEDPDRQFRADTYVDPSEGQPDDLNALSFPTGLRDRLVSNNLDQVESRLKKHFEEKK